MSSTTTQRSMRTFAILAILGLVTMSLQILGAGTAFAAAGDMSTLAGTGSAGYSGDNGPATAAEVNGPYGVAADAAGNVYIADCGNNVIRRVTTGGTITTIAGTGSPGYSGDGGPATAAELNSPCGVSVDVAGNVLIADTSNRVVRKVTPSGTISTIAGTGATGYSGDGGPATAAVFSDIYRVLPVGSSLYIADYINNVVRKVDASGIVSTIAGTGALSTSGDGGPATAAAVASPVGLAVDVAGNIYVVQTDTFSSNNRVRKIDLSGTITTFAGSGPAGYSGDGGPATAARFNNLLDIVFDSSGRAIISDYLNQRVRRVDTNGTVHTIAGDGAASYGGDGASACDAQLHGPLGLALNGAGDLFIGDNSNNAVRQVSAAIPDCPALIRGLITDFDRDARSDVSVFRPSSGAWFDHPSGGGPDTGFSFGASGDVPIPGDYDGDYQTDQAVYRPATGLWAIHNSSGGDTFVTFGGMAGDEPVPGDYDGDGKVDLAIYRPSLGFWYVHRSSDSSDHSIIFGGVAGDLPVPADYDGDGRIDKAIFRPATGTWFVHPSSGDEADYAVSYGASGDIPLPGDYDADGLADVAIFRPSTGLWAIHYSGAGPDSFVTYGGISGDVPVAADYDGDHRVDIAIFRPAYGAWFVHQSTTSTDAVTTFGIGTDTPLPIAPTVRGAFF